MKTLTYQLRDLKKVTIEIGFEGENNRTQVRIDCGEVFGEYPNAAVSMKVQAPKGGIYPATVTREENMILWTVRDCDVANKGNGEFQLTFTDGTTVDKSYVGRFHVDRSLKGSGTAPSGVQDWLENAEKVLEQVESAEIHQPMVGLDGYWYRWDQEAQQYVSTGTKAQGQNGKGIDHIAKTGTSGNVDTYTIYYTDGTESTYTVTNSEGGTVIDDTTPASDKVFSSEKVNTELNTVKSALTSIDEEVNGEKIPSINLFNPSDPDVLDNKYIDGSTGEEVSYNNIIETGFIACEPANTFTFYNSEGYLSGYKHIAYYNAQKQFVSGSTGEALPTITIPSGNIAYFRIALTKNKLTGQMIVKNDSDIHDYVPYGYTMSDGIYSSVYPWKGKAVVCFGDSIMYNDGHNGIKGYPHYMQECGFETITNNGVSGACIAYHSERPQYEDVCETVDDVNFSGYDLAVIAGGVNDYNVSSASPIGALVNSTNANHFDKTTFIGALQYVITTILDAKATIKIVLFTPLKKASWFNENSQGKTLIDYVAAMKQVAEFYSIPVLDYFAMSGLNRKNISSFTSDGLHPNNEGYKFICENKLPAFINTMLTGAGASEKIDKPTAPSSGDFLVFNGTTWAAQSLSTWQGGNY